MKPAEAARRSELQRRLLAWFDANARDLPWRRSRDPYAILVSEVMLQQTQVERVIPYYHRFLERFPTVEALTAAPTADVIQLWAGLGYNRRAVNLQRAAQMIQTEHGGRFPTQVSELKRLPGIGPYTAGAIACFAMEQDVAFIDTNIRRLLTRLFPPTDDSSVETTAAQLVPAGKGWQWNQALIEFGAMKCISHVPDCLGCSMLELCPTGSDFVAQGTVPVRNPGKKEGTFTGSNRQLRGRIVAVLRECETGSALSMAELRQQVSNEMSPPSTFLQIVRDLERDGLLKIAESGEMYIADSDETRLVSLPG